MTDGMPYIYGYWQGIPVHGWWQDICMTGDKAYLPGSWLGIPVYGWWQVILVCLVIRHTYMAIGKAYL